ncbi:RILP-like protein homolog isoform X1 [Frankliniella occidentalis]|uniref:RILP-like protein homolog isoform X1 n=1 Tax=Frankliniella occidentalis TaxID=133901 RepID=A0A6J1SHR1_FRAOC|nr:RILP-like protein homolog isoform X1 [Frankliniella occidentalis]
MPYLEEQELEDTMDDSKPEVSVIDVYDIASEIGKEFEKMIDVYGTDAVINLMPKVINALEQLEGLATRNERENNQIQELKARIAQLEKDKIGKAEDRQRFEMELEQIEEHWREESRDLEAMVSHLQEENRKLSSVLAEKKQAEKAPDPGALLSPEVDMALVQRLRGLVDRLKDQLRQRDRELLSKQTEMESLSSQVEQLTIISRELRRKQRLGQTQIHSLIDERADFLAQLHDQQREVQSLRQRLGLAEKENEDLSISAQDSPDLTNKVIYDKDDPNRPRFTTQELKDILHERNELKARVSDLEDELEMYRPKEPPKSNNSCSSTSRSISRSASRSASRSTSSSSSRNKSRHDSTSAQSNASGSNFNSFNNLSQHSEGDSTQPRPSLFRSTAFIPSLFPLHRLPLPQVFAADEDFASPALSVVVIPPTVRDLEVPLDSNSSEHEQVCSSLVSSTPENTGYMNPRWLKFSTPNINGVRTPCTSPSKDSAECTPKRVSSVMVTLSPDGRVSHITHDCPEF